MAMQQRERILALSLGGIVAAVGLYWAFGKYQSMFATRDSLLTNARKQVEDKEKKLVVAKKAMDRRRELEKRSLPANKELAQSLYQQWLFGIVDGAELNDATVTPTPAQKTAKAYDAFVFNINGLGTIDQVTRLLYEFYSAGHLHQIKRFVLLPADPGMLSVTMTVEALMLPGADRKDSLTKESANNLALTSYSDYQKAIGGRNVFAEYTPPKPPQERTIERTEPAYDLAKLAVVTGWGVGVDGRSLFWLTEKNLSKSTKLYEGDAFQVGPLKGTVKKIHFPERRQVELDLNGNALLMTDSKSLGDALAEQQKNK
jgi:hypothetical protein